MASRADADVQGLFVDAAERCMSRLPNAEGDTAATMVLRDGQGWDWCREIRLASLMLQDRRKASRSALMVSAWVVGMPCGKPW